MKVKTDYVPTEVRGYLTPGKEYECYDVGPHTARFVADNGRENFIRFHCCAHLNGADWTVTGEEE